METRPPQGWRLPAGWQSNLMSGGRDYGDESCPDQAVTTTNYHKARTSRQQRATSLTGSSGMQASIFGQPPASLRFPPHTDGRVLQETAASGRATQIANFGCFHVNGYLGKSNKTPRTAKADQALAVRRLSLGTTSGEPMTVLRFPKGD